MTNDVLDQTSDLENRFKKGSKGSREYMTEERQNRLKQAVGQSYKILDPYRQAVVALTKEYAGPFYGLEAGGKTRDRYLNLLKQTVDAYMTLLASNRPKVLVSTHKLEHRAFAKHYQQGLNSLFKKIELEKVVSQWVRDAFFWMGIVKVHMADTGQQIAEGDLLMDPGMPFASNVALDDFFFDMRASKLSECKFVGDLYRLPLEFLQESDIYSGDELKDLSESRNMISEDRQEEISKTREPITDLEPMVDVCDIWIPRDGKIYTYIVQSRSSTLTLKGNPIAVIDWKGKELGPYKLLHFDEVSENVIPCSTAADLYPLDRLVNNLWRKNAQKAQRLKEINVFSPAGTDTAEKINRANDGEWASANDPKEINKVTTGGVDSGLHGFTMASMEMFDRMAGNLQAMLGLGASTDTVGQEKLVHGSAGRRESKLQMSVLNSTTSLATDLGYLLWIDKFTELPSRTEVPGLSGVSYDSTWSPDLREGEFDDYDFTIDIYSMQYQGPAERVEKVNALLQQVYIPMAPMLQSSGGRIDLAALAKMHAEMLDLPQLSEVVLFDTMPSDPAAMPEGPRKSPVSNRTYTRKNVSGGQKPGSAGAELMAQANQPKS